jgi:hypothetical protein
MIDGNTASSSHHDHVQAITVLRSAKIVDKMVEEKKDEESGPLKRLTQAKDKGVMQDTPTFEVPYAPKAPFPERLKESTQFGKQGEKIQDMLEIFKQVKINIPLLNGIKQIPSYSKFLKDMSTQKRKTKSHTLRHSIPPKFKDPSAPTISCTIGDHKIRKALLDLGAGVNLPAARLKRVKAHHSYLATGKLIRQETTRNN